MRDRNYQSNFQAYIKLNAECTEMWQRRHQETARQARPLGRQQVDLSPWIEGMGWPQVRGDQFLEEAEAEVT